MIQEKMTSDFFQNGKNDFLAGKAFNPPINPEDHPDYGIDLRISEVDEMRENRENYIKGFEEAFDTTSTSFKSGWSDKLDKKYNPPLAPEKHPDFRTGGLSKDDIEEMRINLDDYLKGYNLAK